LDQAVTGMQQQLQAPKPQPQPDPDTVIKAQIEQAKIQSNEKIAMIEAQKDQQIASLKATIELQKIEMKAKFDQVAQQYEQVLQMMNVQASAPQFDNLASAVSQMAQNSAQSQEMTTAQMQALMQAVMRKRKKVPVRDENGDIVEVREVDDDDDDEEEMPEGMANLPQPQAAMGM
jgi:FKBP-type peptidyl-prolyl cis-trans isomerase